jgi:hypothetical protein
MARLGDDWSPTWVEGLVDKLPPRKGDLDRGIIFFPIGVSLRSMSVVAVMIIYINP